MKKITAEIIKKWHEKGVDGSPSRPVCSSLLRDFGSSLPFFVNTEVYELFPFKLLGEEKVSVANLVPALGEAWIVFCYHDIENSESSPIRTDGFMLPLEWRKGTTHSCLLPESIKSLANEVFSFVAGNHVSDEATESWGLHPSYQRFGDNIDFSEEGLFSNVGSAWGALAIGLESALKSRVPVSWPFSSLQFNSTTGKVGHVEGIKSKLNVASSYQCREFVVAPSQISEARSALDELVSEGNSNCSAIRLITAETNSNSLVSSILFSNLDWLRPSVINSPTEKLNFIGRRWLIDSVLSQKTGITVVSASPGQGKTALLNKIAEMQGEQVLLNYKCSQRPAIDFVKTLAYQIALYFPEAFRAEGIEHIRDLAKSETSWQNLRNLYQAAVLAPLNRVEANCQNKEESFPANLIIVDALDETQDRNVAMLLGNPTLKLPDWLKVIISTRPIDELTQLLNRTPLKTIDLDTHENSPQCDQDLLFYIEHKLTSFGDKFVSGIDKSSILQVLKKRCINYRYAYNTFLNISNGTYTFDKIQSQLPKGVQGHYLAFFDSHLSGCWEEVKPLLELLCASPSALSLPFCNSVLKDECDVFVKRLGGYVAITDNALSLCDHVFFEWLTNKVDNSSFYIDLTDGHHRLAKQGWQEFTNILAVESEHDLSGSDLEILKYKLSEEIQDSFGHHIAASKYLNSCDSLEYAPVLLAIVHDPSDAAVIANAIRSGQQKETRFFLNRKKAVAALLLPTAVVIAVTYFNNFSKPNLTDSAREEWSESQPLEYDSKNLIAMELLAEIKRIDQCLAGVKGVWNRTEVDRMMKLWDGRDGSQNKSVSRKQRYIAIETENILNSLRTQFELASFTNIVPSVVVTAVGSNFELRQRIDAAYKTVYTVKQKIHTFTSKIENLRECKSLDEFQLEMKGAEKAGYEMSLWMKIVHIHYMGLIDELLDAVDSRAQVNKELAILSELSPKNLASPVTLERIHNELLRAIKRTQETNNRDVTDLRGRLLDTQKKLEEGYDRIRKKCQINPDDKPAFMWGKVIRLIGAGLYDEANRQLDYYKKYNDHDTNASAVVNSAKAYIKEAERSGLSYGIMVHFIANGLTHSFLKPGDIITHVDGNLIKNDAAYIALREKSGNLLKDFKYLRLNETGVLVEQVGERKLIDPKFGFSDMTEQME